MERLKNALTIIGVVIFTMTYYSANAQADQVTYQAYIGNSESLWDRAVSRDFDSDFNKAMSYYGLLNGTMAEKNEDRFEEYYDQTLELFEGLTEEGSRVAESQAVLSSIYGLAMAYDSWKGMYLGPKSGSLIEKAYAEAPDIPIIRKLYASSKLYTPEMFGGDPQKALENFEVAVELYESEGDTVNNWLYLDAIAHLGIAYRKQDKLEKAIETYEKALAIEPKFGWVKYSLLPSAQKALAKK